MRFKHSSAFIISSQPLHQKSSMLVWEDLLRFLASQITTVWTAITLTLVSSEVMYTAHLLKLTTRCSWSKKDQNSDLKGGLSLKPEAWFTGLWLGECPRFCPFLPSIYAPTNWETVHSRRSPTSGWGGKERQISVIPHACCNPLENRVERDSENYTECYRQRDQLGQPGSMSSIYRCWQRPHQQEQGLGYFISDVLEHEVQCYPVIQTQFCSGCDLIFCSTNPSQIIPWIFFTGRFLSKSRLLSPWFLFSSFGHDFSCYNTTARDSVT